MRRHDQGPEFGAKVLQKMLLAGRVKDKPVPQVQPYGHGHLESGNGSLREELWEAELCHTLGEARAKVEGWVAWYNGERPHQSLGYATPRECRAAPTGAPEIFGPLPPSGRLVNSTHVNGKPTLS